MPLGKARRSRSAAGQGQDAARVAAVTVSIPGRQADDAERDASNPARPAPSVNLGSYTSPFALTCKHSNNT